MSTIPLSAREGYMQGISGSDEPPAEIERDDGKLDALLEAAIDNAADSITDRTKIKENDDELLPIEGDGWAALVSDPEREAPAGREAGLEKILRGREEKLAERELESADFHKSQEWRDTLRHRYGGKLSVEQLLENATTWHHHLTQNPHAAADQLASMYLQAAPYAINDDAPVKAEAPADEHPSRKLDRIIEDAIDKKQNGERNAQEFKATAQQRAALKIMFPGLSFADAMRSLVKFDGDMHRDPLRTAARMGASYGMPVTTGQHVAAQADYERTAPVVQMVEHTAQYLPNYADYQEDMIQVLGRQDFVKSGDYQQDLIRAYRIVDIVRAEQNRIRAENAEKRKPKPRGGLDGLLDANMARAGM